MAVQQITGGMLRHELTFLSLGKVTTFSVENGIEGTANINGFMHSACNGYWM